MKEEVILRILVQESPKLELWLRRHGENKLWGPFCNFWKWLGLYLELFSKTRGLLRIFVDCGLITKKGKGLIAKSAWIFQHDFFFNGKIRWTMDRASVVAHRSSA
jgi:hypothetical protein